MSKKTFTIAGTFKASKKAIIRSIERTGRIYVEELTEATDFIYVGRNPGRKLRIAESIGTTIVGLREEEKHNAGICMCCGDKFDREISWSNHNSNKYIYYCDNKYCNRYKLAVADLHLNDEEFLNE